MKPLTTKSLVSTLALSLVLAAPAALAQPRQPRGPKASGETQPDSTRMERREKRARVMRLVGLAEALDLSSAEALRLNDVMKRFDERRRPLREQVVESARLLKRAATGETDALGQVDQATQRIFDARAQMASIDREMFDALAQGLKPQQRAQLALFLAKSARHMRGMKPGMMKGKRGFGPGPGAGGAGWGHGELSGED